MAARVGLVVLPHAVLASSSRALTLSRAGLPYPPPTFPSHRRGASSAAASPPRLRSGPRRRLLPFRTMASSGNPYAAELAAAKKAVTLAARLCKDLKYW
ncbi:unnamed protein product [Urochloa humidicola]